MKHRMIAGLTALSMLGTALPAMGLPETALMALAEEETPISGTCGENLTWTLDDAGTLTISGTGDMNSGLPWINYRAKIRSIVIEDGVTNIEEWAFSSCMSLDSVTIPDSVTSIGVSAFYGCAALESITIPDSVTSIDAEAFDDCTALTSITILNPACEIYGAYDTIANSSSVRYTGVIKGYEGSTAQSYAEKHNYTFESLGAAPTAEPTEEQALGDLDGDTTVNASDAAKVLIAAAAMGAGEASGLTEAQIKAADVNTDNTVNASDAAIILIYSAAVGAGDENAKITDFVK
ncbi:MAG: leucine-rich repeat protein [Oscillospiraceae bacterium]|nr:leucine-rich repeat protein [Oscillospiraceae bacterium]